MKPKPLLIPSACRHHDCEHGTSPAIAQVNQQIRKEFQDIFYVENTFEYHIHRCDFTYLFDWMSTVEDHNRKRVRNIQLTLRDRWTCGEGLLDLVRWCAKEKCIEQIVWTVDGALDWSKEHTTYANARHSPALEPDAWVEAMHSTQDALEKALELSYELAKRHKSSEFSIRKAFERWLKEFGFPHELHTYPRCVHKSRKRDGFMQSSAGGFCSVEDRLAGTRDHDISFATAVCYFNDEGLSAVLRN